MLSHALYFFIFLHMLSRTPTTAAAAATAAYTATDFILVNCGASSILNDTSGRKWDADDRSIYTPSDAARMSSAVGISAPSRVSYMDPSVSQVPYETASIYFSPFTYAFPVSAGPKFLRLYFYAGIHSGFDISRSFFSVTANSFTLLSNFSAFLYSKSSSQPSFMKEFVINIEENQGLNLTFAPSPKSFAFVNGIEIVSGPDKLYFRGGDVPIKYRQQIFYLNSSTALENLYRLNVGGARVDIQDDSGPTRGMFRAWSPDDDYIYSAHKGWIPHRENVSVKYTTQTPPYSAPEIVYTSARILDNYSRSLGWRFPVDSGFHYLLRLHFCEFMLEVTKLNQRTFTISINNQTAELTADVIAWTSGPQIPIFRDYITLVPDHDGRREKQNLWLNLTPYSEGRPMYHNVLLNGLEIFKLSDSERSLAAANLEPVTDGKKKGGGSFVAFAVIGSVIGVLVVVGAASFLIFRRQQRLKDSPTKSAAKSTRVPLSTELMSTTRTSGSGVSLPPYLCRHFSLDEIKNATCEFNDSFVVGKGGFGNVYKGLIDDGSTTVAIKRLNRSSNQGVREFVTEIEMLSKLRHVHLVSLIGCCDENEEMILVYDYMAQGTLRDHLYNSERAPLSWNQRLQTCIGAAKGLHYLHTGLKNTIIHRDVKSTNILLDEKWVAKISDFGLSKTEPANDSYTHISTNVKGTFGYLDPEYFLTSKLTRKSDVYAFGVVLFEVLSGRPAVDIRLEEEEHSLARWARYCIDEGEVDRLIDNNMMGQISPACLEMFVGIAGRCLHAQPQRRPAMADVVMALELALILQQTTDPTEQVEEKENAGTTYSDQSDGVVSMDDITLSNEESEGIISEDNARCVEYQTLD